MRLSPRAHRVLVVMAACWLTPMMAVADDEPGFGGTPAVAPNEFIPPPTRLPAQLPVPPAQASTVEASPAPPEAEAPPDPAREALLRLTADLPPTALEMELAKARLDPARFPLLQARVDVARLVAAVKDFEGKGLTRAREAEEALATAKAFLADLERIGLHRMNVCLARSGRAQKAVRNFRMTAAGPVRKSTPEMMADASIIDPDGCARIELVDQALVDRLRRAQLLTDTLEHTNFPYHRIAERRALEAELKGLQKQLATEDLPIISMPGAADPYGH